MTHRALITAAVAACVLLALFPAGGRAQAVLEAPGTVTLGGSSTSLTVVWTAPASDGGSAITAYDLRYTADDNSMVEEDIWSSGALQYELTGLQRDTSYKVEVRAVNANGDGPWSDPTSGATTDHGDSMSSASLIALDSSLSGRIDESDTDWFSFTVTGTEDIWIYSASDAPTDLVGELFNAVGDSITRSSNSYRFENTRDFSLRSRLQTGTYYVQVTSSTAPAATHTRPYVFHARRGVTPGTSFETAATIEIGVSAAAYFVDPQDEHFFTFTVERATDVWLLSEGSIDTVAELRDSNRTWLAGNDDGFLDGIERGFLISATLRPGEYYLSVTSFSFIQTGPYVLRFLTGDNPGNTPQTAATVPLYGIATGNIASSSDRDYFRLTMDAPTEVRLRVLARGLRSINLAVFDENGIDVTGDFQSTRDPVQVVGFMNTGTYSVRITSGESGRQRYLLRVEISDDQKLLDECSASTHTYADPLYGCQWHLSNTGQFDGADQDINVEAAWGATLGSGVNVAVVDGPMRTTHPDLRDNIVTARNHNFFSPPDADDEEEELFHATAVAGLVGARDNELGVRGVAPRASLHSIDLLGGNASLFQEAQAMALHLRETHISNNSWGPLDTGVPQPTHSAWFSAIERGVRTGAGGKGISYVWAAGNGGPRGDDANLDEYANHYGVTAVCAVNIDDTRSVWSEKGANLWVCAPSDNDSVQRGLMTTAPSGYEPDFGGTSGAAPVVSGVIALMRAANPDLTWRDVKLILAATARKNDSTNSGWEDGALQYGSSTERYSFNHEYGFGVVDAGAAVARALTWPDTDTLPAFREITGSSTAAPLLIPDLPDGGTSTTITSTLEVDNYVDFVEFLEINIDLTHTSMRDLDIDLVSPSGVTSRLARKGQGYVFFIFDYYPSSSPIDGNHRFGSARHLGENAAGPWTLQVTDRATGNSGTLKSWSVTAYGHGHTPDPPAIQTVTSAATSVTVVWTAPGEIGRSAITKYDLQYRRADAASGVNWTPVNAIWTSGELSYELTGLDRGRSYDLQVRAVSASGASPWSPPMTGATLAIAPESPAIESIQPRNGKLIVEWSVPGFDGGAPISRYDVRHVLSGDLSELDPPWTILRSVGARIAPGQYRYTVSGLVNDASHTVQVRAANRVGDGEWSDAATGTPDAENTNPAFLEGETASRSLREDVAVGTVVGAAFLAVDADSDPLKYTVSGEIGPFSFDPATAQLRVAETLDYETTTTYTIKVQVKDGQDGSGNSDTAVDATIDVTITVEDLDEGFEISGAAFITREENTTGVLETYTATDPEGKELTWSTGGTDADDFTLVDGALSFALTPDYEAPLDADRDNVYSLDVSASDGFNVITVAVTVAVGDVDEFPVITGPSEFTIAENTVNREIGTYTATDPEDRPLEWDELYSARLHGPDYGDFDFLFDDKFDRSGRLRLQRVPDFESPTDADSNNVYEVIIHSNDFEGPRWQWETFDVQVTVTNVNEPPVVSGPTALTRRENSDVFLGAYEARDPDAGDTASWGHLEGDDADHFEIDASGRLSFRTPPDFEARANNVYQVIVVASDDGGLEARREVMVTVEDVDEPPLVMGTRAIDHAENAGTALANASYSATDPEGANITWSVGGNDGGKFAISDGELSFAEPPDFEAPADSGRDNVYNVIVRASDGPNNDDHDVTVTVTDEDEDEELKFSAPRPFIGADYTAAFKEGMGDAVQSPTWVWARSMSRSGSGTDITGATAATYRPVGADRDNYLRVTASYNDGHSAKTLQATSEFPTLPDSSTNRPPVFPSPLFAGGATGLSVDENATAGTVVGVAPQATDPELGTLSYSLAVTGFTTDPPFEINATSREIRVASDDVLDHEDQDSYSVTVTAKDEYNATKTATFDITIADVNERPVVRRRSGTGAFSIVENSGTDVGSFVATDPEGGGVTWSLATSGDHGRFEIDAANGALSFKEAPDYERSDLGSDKAYTVTVQATEVDDGNPLTGSLDVTVTIADVNERPVVRRRSGTGAFSIVENSGTDVGRFVATDPEGGGVTWSLATSGDHGRFEIDAANGALSFKEAPDYESSDLGSDKAYTVTVQATEVDDGDPLTGSLAVTVTITNVNERPVVRRRSGAGAFSIVENSGTDVGSFVATDPEGAGVTWSDLSGNDADDFDLSNNGVLTFKVSPNFEVKSEYEVTLNAFDGGLPGSLDVTVTITDVNEQPMVTRSSGTGDFSIAENSGTTVGDFDATDPEGHAVTWSLETTGDHGRFEIDAANGALSFKELPDYESSDLGSSLVRAYNVTVQATEQDDGEPLTLELTGDLDVTVAVTDVNEPPTITGKATPSVDENTTAVATYRATDPDERATITWSVEDPGAGDFTITNAGGALSFASAPNYEVKSSYTVTVRASDGTNTDDHDVTVAVTDVDEPEVLVLSDPRPLIGLDFTAAFKGTGDNVDNVQPPTWAWARSAMGSSSGWMPPITDATNATYEPTGDDRERYLRVTVSYNDGHSAKTLQATSVLPTLPHNTTNTPPVFPSPLFTGGATGLSVDENAGVRTVVGVAPQATDLQGGGLTYSLAVDGFTIGPPFEGPPFEINATSRQIRVVRAVLNHEGQDTYGVTVTVKDEYNAPATATFDIRIEDVNERPVAVADPSVTTAEDTPVTFDVLRNDTDPDEGDTLTVMTITTQPRRGRVVVDSTRQMVTYTPVENDHGTYTFMYTARDDDPVRMLTSPPARVTITVNPVNDAPEFETETTTRTVSEGAQPGDDVGTKVAATDVDGDTLTYSLAGASEFVIDDTGQISVAPRVTLDREDTPSYTATVTASDRLNESDSITVTINVSDVPEPPTAMNDTARTDEDQSVKIDVLANDTDPDTERANLRVSVGTQPLNGRARVESDRTITYTPNANYHGPPSDSFTYTVSDGSLSDAGSVTVTVTPVNDAPEFATEMTTRTVPEDAEADDDVGAPVTATDVDENDTLTYSLSGADSGSFNIDSSGQITVAERAALDAALSPYSVTVIARDPGGDEATVEVTITVTAGPVIIITGGGSGGPSGPSPSEVDFEWTVKRDIEALDGGNDWPTGLWSDGETLWIAENGQGADDEVYAYDRASGERLSEREFTLAETNRAPRGFWSDGVTVWVSDSGRERLFAYRLADGERVEEREFALAAGNSDARGIWSDEETMWVLDGRADRLFAYALASGELLAEYALDSANSDPHGIWSDGVTVWVSDHGAKWLFAYRLEGEELTRNRDEEFTELSKASNNSPRGIWSDGDVMYVADESDDRVYTYNMPDAIDARLASLTLSGVEFGEFDPGRTDYEAVVADGVTETTVEAEAMQRRTDVAIDPPDADGDDANGHQVALQDLGEITVTVTSQDGSRKKVYRVALEAPPVEFALTPAWTAIDWPGAGGVATAEAGLPDAVVAVYRWDEATAAWLAFFPGLEDVPGLNTLTTLSAGATYWVAVSEPVTWSVVKRGAALAAADRGP